MAAVVTEGAEAQWVTVVTAESLPVRFRRNDNQLVLEVDAAQSIRRFQVFLGRGPPPSMREIAALRDRKPVPLSAWKVPGPLRWHPLETRGQRAPDLEAFAIDTVTVPYENPWRALFFLAGVDFFPNGDAAVCTIHGDVWRVSGLDDKLERVTWRRFATGLFQPLGLRVRDGRAFVLGRDQITRLHDANEDGEADHYEAFFNGIRTSTGGHDYVTSLDLDANGNFYYVDPAGVHRVSADGAKHETLAAGWRNPNGMGVSPDGRIITVAPQQGEWTPSSAICEVRSGGWYGHGGPRPAPGRPAGVDAPLCWIPRRIDNSGGSQLWVTSDRWAGLRGQLLHFSFGRCAQFLVLRDVFDEGAQGAVVPLPGRFLSGIMRGAFNPRDGQLYVTGSRGWQTSAVRDGCLQRVRATGKTAMLPVHFAVHQNGLKLTFSVPLDRISAEDPENFGLAHWNYRYASSYGSKDYAPSQAETEGHESLPIQSVQLLEDGRTVFLHIDQIRPVMQFELKYTLKTTENRAFRGEIYGTIHRQHPAFPTGE